MTDENYEAHAQAQLASLKRDMKASMEDAVVRAMHKVMAEFEAKSDERLMEDWGPGPHECHSLPEQPAQPATYTCGVCGVSMQMEQPAQQQEPVAWMQHTTVGLYVIDHCDEWHSIPLYTTPPQRKPLTDEEIESLWDHGMYVHCSGITALRAITRAIEAKLREKNA